MISCPRSYLGVIFVAIVALSPIRVPRAIAQDTANRYGIALRQCDDATMRDYVRAVIGDGLHDVIIRDSAGRCSTVVRAAGTTACFRPLHKGCGVLPSPGGADSLRLWFYTYCDTAAERAQLCWLVPAGGTSFRMAVMADGARGLEVRQDVDLASLLFPKGSHQSGSNLPDIQSVSLMPSDGKTGCGILSIKIEDNSSGNHPHSDAREGFWYCVGDSLVWVGSLWRGLSTVSGAESVRGFESQLDPSGTVGEPLTFDYRRSLDALEGVWSGELKDIFPTVIRMDSLGLRVLGMRVASDSMLPLRNLLPMLVAERYPGSVSRPASPPELVLVPLFAQAGVGEPLMGPGSASGRGDYYVRQQLKRSVTESLSGWVEGDSLVLSFCMPDERKVAFWFAPRLSSNDNDSSFALRRRVYVVHPHWRTSPFRVEGYQVNQTANGIKYALVDSGVGVFRWFNEGLEVTLRISRKQIGFESSDSLAVCGFGMESLWWEYDLPDKKIFEVAPAGFNRHRSETWGNLVLGRREDIINERRLERHQQLERSRGKQH